MKKKFHSIGFVFANAEFLFLRNSDIGSEYGEGLTEG